MATKTVLETLEAARKLISLEGAWTQNALAVDSRGSDIDAQHPQACRWCSAGAIVKVCGGFSPDHHAAIDLLESQVRDFIGSFNDTHTHAEVLAAFDEAIAKEKEAQHA